MPKRFPLVLLILFVLLDLGYTFRQHYQLPLEGDMPQIVLPAPECRQVLQDPFGWAALTRQEVYVAPNRFFAHAAMVGWFHSVPLGLQRFLDPISSIYAACALFGVAVQALLLYLMGVYITGSRRLSREQWVVIALLVPLFQMGGYNTQMGIIDHSITYTFFYAFPLALLLLLLLPFYEAARTQQPLRVTGLSAVAMVLLMVVLAFNGTIVIGTMGVLGLGIGAWWLWRQRGAAAGGRAIWQRIPWPGTLLLAVFGLLCLYSFYLGQFEAESQEHILPLWDRYLRLPSGIYWQLRQPALPLLVGAALLNYYLISRLAPATAEGQRWRRVAVWFTLFAVVFVLVLPLAGYRRYRPLILRRDSIMPLLLGLMIFYGGTTYFLLRFLQGTQRRRYLAWVGVLSAFYLVSDNIWLQKDNVCERQALQLLRESPQDVVLLPNDCTVLAWGLMTDPAYSENQAQLLEFWNVTWGKRLYYQAQKQ